MSKRFIISREMLMGDAVQELIEPDVNENTEIDTVEVIDKSELDNIVEEAVATEELRNEIMTMRQDYKRMRDNAHALNDLSIIVASMEELSPIHRALIYNALNFSVAGTDADVTKVLPGFETFADTKEIAKLSEMKSRALMTSSHQLMGGIFDKLKQAFSPVKKENRKVPPIKESIEKLKTYSKTVNTYVTFSPGHFYVTKNLRTINNPEEIMKLSQAAFDSIERNLNNVLNQDGLEKIVKEFDKLYPTWDDQKDTLKILSDLEPMYKKVADSVEAMFPTIETTSFINKSGVKKTVDIHHPGIGCGYLYSFRDTPYIADYNYNAQLGPEVIEIDAMDINKLVKALTDYEKKADDLDVKLKAINDKTMPFLQRVNDLVKTFPATASIPLMNALDGVYMLALSCVVNRDAIYGIMGYIYHGVKLFAGAQVIAYSGNE